MTKTILSTPRADGFRMPGEFEPHRGTWILWPERTDNWRNGAKPAQLAFVDVAKAIARSESVTVGVSASQWRNARNMLPPEVRVVEMSYNDSWIRDCGPIFVVDGRGGLRVTDWDFNAWGGLKEGLYFPWDLDDLVPRKVAEIEGVDRYEVPMVLEGGSVLSDGEGTILATEECLLNPNRNPEMSRGDIEQHLRDYLGAEKVIWLGQGVFNDEANGHVDNLVAFVRPGVVVLTWTEDQSDPQYEISCDAKRRLEEATDARGRRLEVHLVPSPSPVLITKEESEGVDAGIEGSYPRNEGDRLPASYINSYIASGHVIVPLLDERCDAQVLKQYAKLFPDRKVVGVPAREILLGGGNIHCIVQQVPAPR